MRAAAIQLNASDDVERNLETADGLVRHAASLGAELIVLPECWTVMGTREQLGAGAQTLDGTAVSWARATAAELGVDLIAGSLSERRDGEPPLANTSVHVQPSGEIAAIYRKIHLFDVEIDGAVYGEASTFAPGSEIVVTTLGDGTRAGLTICFDLRYPELYRILALRGAELVTVPSAFTLRTTRDHWEVLLRARAIENQCFVVAPNQIGQHPGGLRSGGRSLIIDPWGVVLAGASDGEGVIVAELDFDVLRRVREQLPTLTRREPDAYDWSAAAPVTSHGSGR
ncbi:MAG TPA: carbon-nitrogen hydrolase family protein [Solirubrobacteraceae bacterium]|nr:carbon-nitrogen hydrolase family protein [Solirubrobacteraceae bacterium]